MTLPYDTARCEGHKPYGILATPCRDCQRQTETVHHEYRQSWMRPVPIIGNVCATRIAPFGEKND